MRTPLTIASAHAQARSPSDAGPTDHAGGAADASTAEIAGLARLVVERIRPAVQADGGDVEFVGVTASGIVQVRLHGACVGCPSATMTLRAGIERNLREYVPGISGVEALD